MFKILATLPLLFLPGAVFGKTFECKDIDAAFSEMMGKKAPVLVVATVNADGITGTIEVADRKFQADYQVEGLDRSWRFLTAKDQAYGYLLLIQPDGNAAYYDLETSEGQPAPPDQVFSCREKKFSEQHRLTDRDSSEMAAYQMAIAQKIRRNWAVPASAGPETKCSVQVTQLPNGDVVGVNIISCNGDDAVRRSVEAAIPHQRLVFLGVINPRRIAHVQHLLLYT